MSKKSKRKAAKVAKQIQSNSPPIVQNAADSGGAWAPGYESLRTLLDSVANSSGIAVNATTAMKSTAVFRCVSIIAGALATLPIKIFERETRIEATDHPIGILLSEQPSDDITAATHWEMQGCSILLKGDGFAWIEKNNSGDVLGLHPIDPSLVTVGRRTNNSRVPERLFAFQDHNGHMHGLDQSQILQFPGVGFNGLRGMSPIRQHLQQSVGIALAAEQYTGSFFGSGAHPDVVLESPRKMTDPQIEQLRETWSRKYGGINNAFLPIVLSEGMKHSQLTMNATDAQLIESRAFQITDICRAFGVPPFMAGETGKQSMWGTGVEHISIGFARYTMRPHLNRIEQELNRKLFPNRQFYVKFDLEELMSGDSAALAAYFGAALGGSNGSGWLTPNEVRVKAGEPRIENDPRADQLIYWPPEADTTTGGTE